MLRTTEKLVIVISILVIKLISIAFILFMFIVALSELNIGVLILKNGSQEELVFSIKALSGLIKYRLELPFIEILKKGLVVDDLPINSDIEVGKKEVIKDHKEKDISLEEMKNAYKKIKLIFIRYKKIFIYINRRIVFDKIAWATEVGTGDAANTAIVTGSFWLFKSNLFSLLKKQVNLKDLTVNVVPYYEGEKFNTSFHCIFTLKTGYIIIAGLKILYSKIKRMVKFI